MRPLSSDKVYEGKRYRIKSRKDQDGEPFKTIEIFDYYQWIELKREDPLYGIILLEDLKKVEHD